MRKSAASKGMASLGVLGEDGKMKVAFDRVLALRRRKVRPSRIWL